MDKQDIEEFIAYELHELTWHHNYPINEGVAVWSVINGLKDNGFKVSSHSPFKVFYVFEHDKKVYELSTEVSTEEISLGWKHSPKNSPPTLYDSICLIIDKLQENIKKQYPKWSVPRELYIALWEDRRNKYPKIRKSMEKYFLDFFRKYHEGILTPLNTKDQKIENPKILENLIKSEVIDLERINDALKNWIFDDGYDEETGYRFRLSNVVNTVAFLKEGKPLPTFFAVSQMNVKDYIWGVYLLELAKLKNYPVKYQIRGNPIEYFCEHGWNTLTELIV